MRRHVVDTDPVPAALRTFTLAGTDPVEVQLDEWKDARRSWTEANGGWPGGTTQRIREERAARRLAFGMPVRNRRPASALET